MVEHTTMVRDMMPFLLLLWIAVAAVAVGLIVLPRSVVRTILKVGGLFFVGLLIAIIFRGLVYGAMHGPAWVFFFLLLCGLTFLLVWGLSRLLSTSPPGDGRVDTRPLGFVRDLIAQRLPPRDRKDGRAKLWPLFLAVFLMGFALLLLSESAFKPGHPATTVFFFIIFFVGLLVVFWAILQAFILPVAHAPRIDCPPMSRLKDFLSERLRGDERAGVADHLDRCPVCQHRVEGLTAGQGAWSVVARKLTEASPPPEPVLKRVMDNLKGMPEQEKPRDEPSLTADLPLGFLSPSDKPGQLGRLDRYDVLAEVGRGGMGVVLKAFDPSLHRVVAIKVLAPQLATSGVARKRFLREAKAAAAVTHDHIVTIHAVEESNGLPYLVMQYIAGQSLQERIDKEGPIGDLAEVIRIGMQTASALAAAHSHGIVHRDIKPGNILLEEGVQRVKITDFGLARAMDDASLTQSGYVAGSPLYMAPEQARGEALDHRADLFSLGSVLYTMCTGRPPFRAANTLAVLRRVCEDAPRPVRHINAEIPEWLAAIIEKLMAKEPGDRFQSAGEVVDALGQHLAQLQHGAWKPSPHPSPMPAGAASVAGLPTSLNNLSFLRGVLTRSRADGGEPDPLRRVRQAVSRRRHLGGNAGGSPSRAAFCTAFPRETEDAGEVLAFDLLRRRALLDMLHIPSLERVCLCSPVHFGSDGRGGAISPRGSDESGRRSQKGAEVVPGGAYSVWINRSGAFRFPPHRRRLDADSTEPRVNTRGEEQGDPGQSRPSAD